MDDSKEALIKSTGIPSGAKARMIMCHYGGTEIPPYQNAAISREEWELAIALVPGRGCTQVGQFQGLMSASVAVAHCGNGLPDCSASM
jgi:hypothetical protein